MVLLFCGQRVGFVMDCRKFHRNLEDYLEGGLDFSGRFGMERHARQCIGCGKELSGAERLRGMARELSRVKAPANFESALLDEIGRRKAHGCFSGLRRFWLYGIELPSLRKLALAGSFAALLSLGSMYLFHNYLTRGAAPQPAPANRTTPSPPRSPVVEKAERIVEESAQVVPAVTAAASVKEPDRRQPPAQSAASPDAPPQLAEASVPPLERKTVAGDGNVETDYIEYQVFGSGNRPVSFRVPNTPRVRYGRTPEEYFIRNVSH